MEGDPPLGLVTLLRLIDAVLDQPENATLFNDSSDEIRFEYYAKFYEDGGLEKITNVLGVSFLQGILDGSYCLFIPSKN